MSTQIEEAATISSAGGPSVPTVASLRSTLLNQSGSVPLDARFRALFTLKGLAASHVEAVIAAIGEGFRDDSALLKHELAYVLGQIGDTRAIPVLEQVLSDLKQDPMVRHEAAEALGAISSPSVLPLLQTYLTDSDVSVRETCELAIRKIQWDDSEEGREARRRREDVLRRMKESGQQSLKDGEDGLVLGPVDPAPAISSGTTSSSATATPAPSAQPDNASASDILARVHPLQSMLVSPKLPLWERYRAMFSLRDLVLSAVRLSQGPLPSASERSDAHRAASAAVHALAAGLRDEGSALFRHEICFVFGELVHPASTRALLQVLQDEKEHEMVRHEAAEALGGIVEEEPEGEDVDAAAGAPPIPSKDDVLAVLRHYATDTSSPRVVRESCVVALDELAYNNDPSQFQRVEAPAQVEVA